MSEDLRSWKVQVTDLLAHRAPKQHITRVSNDLFLDYPTPEALANAREDELRGLLYPLGMARTRARRLIALSSQFTQP